MSEPLRMETLRERVARAIADGRYQPAVIEHDRTTADRVLAALGLDDLDAAVERAGKALMAVPPDVLTAEPYKAAKNALEAALTATEATRECTCGSCDYCDEYERAEAARSSHEGSDDA